MEKLSKSLRNPVFGGLLFIFLLGFGLRLYRLTKDDIWLDESVSIMAAKMTYPELLKWTLTIDSPDFPPIYYIILKYWIKIFGDYPGSVRMFSVICGLLTIPIIYKIGKYLFGEKHGLLAALLLALSPQHIYYSQETRVYTLEILLICLSIYYFVRAFQENRFGFWLIYISLILFAIHTHYISIFIWCSIFIYHIFILIRKNISFPSLLSHLYSQWTIMVCILPLNIFRFTHFAHGSVPWIGPFKLSNYYDTLIYLLFGVPKNYTKLMQGVGIFISALCSIISIIYLIKMLRREKNNSQCYILDNSSRILLLWTLFLGPALIFTIISITFQPSYVASRYLIIILPAFILILSHALLLISWKYLRICLIILLVLLSFITDIRNHRKVLKGGMKNVAHYIEHYSQSQDVIFFVPNYLQGSFFYYFRKPIINLENMWEKLKWEHYYMDEQEKSIIHNSNRVWLVVDQKLVYPQDYYVIWIIMAKEFGKPISEETIPPQQVQVFLFQQNSNKI